VYANMVLFIKSVKDLKNWLIKYKPNLNKKRFVITNEMLIGNIAFDDKI
jgi:hypothetical protein